MFCVDFMILYCVAFCMRSIAPVSASVLVLLCCVVFLLCYVILCLHILCVCVIHTETVKESQYDNILETGANGCLEDIC